MRKPSLPLLGILVAGTLAGSTGVAAALPTLSWPVLGGASGADIVMGGDGKMWASVPGLASVLQVDNDGQATRYIQAGGYSYPRSLALGDDGRVWMTDSMGGVIRAIDASGNASSFSPPFGAKNIIDGPDGRLWFVEGAEDEATVPGRIGAINTDGTGASVITSGASGTWPPAPEGMTSGPDGNVWVTNPYANKLSRVTPGGTVTNFPVPGIGKYITSGPDGNLWVTEAGAGLGAMGARVARITTAGDVTWFDVSPGKLVTGITTTSSGKIAVKAFRTPAGDQTAIVELNTDGSVFRSVPLGATAIQGSRGGIARGPGQSIWWMGNQAYGCIDCAPGAPPATVGSPTLTGPSVAGSALSTSTGSWVGTGVTTAIQWQKSANGSTGWTNATGDGNQSSSYTLTASDVGFFMRSRITATDAWDQQASSDAAPTASAVVLPAPPANTGSPTASGTPEVFGSLNALEGVWTGVSPAYSYSWERSPSGTGGWAPAGQTGASLALGDSDLGSFFRVEVTGTDPFNQAATATSAPVGPVSLPAAPANTGLPSLSGPTTLPASLSVEPGTWLGTQLSRSVSWQTSADLVNWSDRGGAADSLVLARDDVGRFVRAQVTMTDAWGRTATAMSAPSELVRLPSGPALGRAPGITGLAKVGAVLRVEPGAWSGSGLAMTYKWERAASNSEEWVSTGTTGASFTLSSKDAGERFRVSEVATDEWGQSGSAPSPASIAVVPEGEVGITIDEEAMYTNEPDVNVAVVWPVGATSVRLSNDGGFRRAVTMALDGSLKWKLQGSGPERLPKTVYARFAGPGIDSNQTFTDDIILDQTLPIIVSMEATPLSSEAARSPGRTRSILVRVAASDRTSGVKKLQVGASRKQLQPPRPFSRQAKVRVRGSRLVVRVQDGAGNWSRWQRASIS